MPDYKTILESQRLRLLKSIEHLNYSYNKIQKLSNKINMLDEEQLETWESFAARFARVADMFLSRYLRSVILMNDPGFNGTLRDMVNLGEKMGLIDNANHWMSIRELRNVAAHEYSDKDLEAYFLQLKQACPTLLQLKKLLLSQ